MNNDKGKQPDVGELLPVELIGCDSGRYVWILKPWTDDDTGEDTLYCSDTRQQSRGLAQYVRLQEPEPDTLDNLEDA